MAGTIKRLVGPAYFGSSAADVLAAPASGTKYVVRHIHVANVTGGAITFTLYLGATGGSTGGTELFKGKSVPANDAFDYYCYLEMNSTDFLSGLASAGTSLTVTIEGEKAYL